MVENMVFGPDTSELPPPPQSTGAAALVTQGFDTAQSYASNAFSEAVAFLAQISNAAGKLNTLQPVDGTLAPIAAAIDTFVAPPVPVAPSNLSLNLPAVPAAPNLAPVTGISPGVAPQFTAVPPPIDLSFPVPGPLTATPPTAPGLAPVTIPDAPAIQLPDVPSLVGINVPTEPLLNLPTFTAVQPDSPLAPQYIFGFSEQAYTSQLLQDLRAQLDAWVNGASTGLSPEVEQAIWNRDRTRTVTAAQQKINESVRTFAMRGFPKPPGALSLDIQQALQDAQSQVIAQSRDVAIKQADLEQGNRRFAFETAWKVEEGLITYNGQIAQRAFETAKFAQQVGIDIFHEVVGKYTADIQAYVANVEVFKAALQAELSKLDVYKAELEGQRLITEINVQAVEVYKARIGAAQQIVEMFRAQVEAANTEAMVNKTTIDAFAAQVGAYAETVRAKASEYDMYATRVKAEVSKIDIFSAEASAYNSQVSGFKSTVDALVAAKNIEMDVSQRLPLDVFKALTDVYRVQVGAEVDRVGALNKSYETSASVFNSEVQAESTKINSEVAVYKAQSDVAVAGGNLRIEAAKANVQLVTEQVQLLVEAIKGGAQVAAQLAAAALSSVNLSGQIGDHVSYGVGYNVGVSQSSSVSSSTSNVTSDSTSSSTSNVTSHSSSDSTINSAANNVNTNYNFSN